MQQTPSGIRDKKALNPFYLVVGLIVFVLFWFYYRSPEPSPPDWTPNPVRTESTDSEFKPDAHNVSPAMHAQLETLRKQVVLAPDDTVLVFRFARLLQDAHKPDEAASYYRHYLALHPDNYQAWLDMTQCYGQSEMWHEAEQAVTDMLIRYPGDASALYNLGAIYANQSRLDEAQSIWHRIIKEDKDAEVTALAENSLRRLTPR